MSKVLKCVLCFMILGSSLAYAQTKTDLMYMTENARPFNWEENGELKGLAVELLRLMWDRMGMPHQKIKLYPWARAYFYLQEKPNTVLFSTSRTEHRENMFKWVCPIKRTKYSLIARKDRNIKIATFDDAKKYEVGSIRDDVAEQLLKNKNFPDDKIQPVADIRQNIHKINIGRIDLMTFNEESMYNWIKKMGFKTEDFETVYVIQETPVCYAFNKGVSDDVITQFQNALDQIVKKPEYQKLHDKYFGN
ncbi:MAG: transporter substrate-binding domain-containing protein [Desulfobacterales bacterium]|nr:transporter substrate-binding domain-containing protein [Desulfobacterales bacterium]